MNCFDDFSLCGSCLEQQQSFQLQENNPNRKKLSFSLLPEGSPTVCRSTWFYTNSEIKITCYKVLVECNSKGKYLGRAVSPWRPLQPQAQRHAVVADLRALVWQRPRGETVSFIVPTKAAAINTPAHRHTSPYVDPIPGRARVPETCLVFSKHYGGTQAASFASLLQVRGYGQPDSSLDSQSSSLPREGAAPGQLHPPGKASAAPSTHPATTGLKTAGTVRVPCSTVPIHLLGDGCFISRFCLRCLCLSEGAVIIYNLHPIAPGGKKVFVFKQQFVMQDPKPNHMPA